MNESVSLFSKLLNYFRTLEVFFHWLICVLLMMEVLISSRICLLIIPISDFDGLPHGWQAEVTTPTTRETYIGHCDTTFKLRYRNHICSFRNERYRHATELSKHVWSLKDQNIKFDVKWRKVKQARSYSNVTKKCNLCLWEKYFIICKPEMSTLNNRNELTSCCRHSRKFLLKNVIT